MPSLYQKLTRFEFWPYQLFYAPVYVQLIAAGLRKGGITQFVAANPGIPYGGLLEYSKDAITRQLPEDRVPRTVVVPMRLPLSQVESRLDAHSLDFPIIAKPDRGERGFMVEKLASREDLGAYMSRAKRFCDKLDEVGLDGGAEHLLLQNYINEPAEFGVMYVRRPGARRGAITSIVYKELLYVDGDGSSSVGELIRRGERTRIHRQMLLEAHGGAVDHVPAAGERFYLVEIGNHARGATFRDATAAASEALLEHIEPLARAIGGFYVGRFDIRCRDFAALEAGAFHVIEVNGVNSEPAHIYDPSNSIRAAYRDLLSHWREVERIAWRNRRLGTDVPDLPTLIAAIKRHNLRLRAQGE